MLTPSQQQAAAAIAKGLNLREIADNVGVSIRTIQRWQVSEDFAAEVSRLQVEFSCEVEQVTRSEVKSRASATNRLVSLFDRAIDRLEEVIENPDSRPSDLLKACQLLGKWNGWESDFNISLANLRNSYGLRIWRDEAGVWHISDER
jgi:transcriptional regulator with XRE-family HTH domain